MLSTVASASETRPGEGNLNRPRAPKGDLLRPTCLGRARRFDRAAATQPSRARDPRSRVRRAVTVDRVHVRNLKIVGGVARINLLATSRAAMESSRLGARR